MEAAEIHAKAIAAALIMNHAVEVPTVPTSGDWSKDTAALRLRAVGARDRAVRMLGRLEDAVLLLLLALVFPLIIVGIGAPVALVVRLVLKIAGRL